MGKPDTLIVRAAHTEKPVFMHGHPLRELDSEGRDKWVIRDTFVEVPNDAHYRKQVREGDLVEGTVADLAAPAPMATNEDQE